MPTALTRTTLATLISSLAIAAGAHADLALEEIVVTAQKRSQNLQDVGITVAAFSGETLRELGVQSLNDVPAFTPNVEMYDEYGSGQPTWVIRGVGLQDFNANNTPASAIYIDDVYQTSNTMGGLSLFDLERIEVLKGPQGALYGRNTSGGAVRVVSNRPALDESNGYALASYGRWDNAIAEGAVNVPLADKAALRVSGRWNQSGDGWQTSLPTGAKHGEKDQWALRGQLLLELSPQAELLLRVHGAEDNSETVLGRSIGLYDPITTDYCDALYSGRLDDNSCASYATFWDPEFRFPGVQDASGRTTLSDPINQVNNQSRGGSAELRIDFDAFTLTSITGYEDFDFDQLFDYDGSQGEFGHQHGSSQIEAWSQELRFASTGDGPDSWLIGLEYAQDDFSENRDFLLGDDPILSEELGQSATLNYDQDTESWAAYAQFEHKLAEQWSLNVGLRYTDESKHYRNGGFTSFYYGDAYPLVSGISSDTDLQLWSGKIGLDWTPADNTLIYASLSRGFKSGGFYGGFPDVAEPQASVAPYKEETVLAYELGFKSQWAADSLRLNGALFYYDYSDVQGYLSVFSDFSGTIVTRLGNQGDAEHKGAELDMEWLPVDGLKLQLAASWLDAEITDSDVVSTSWLGTLEPLQGLKRRFAPEWSYSALAQYRLPIGAGDLMLQLDYSWRDDVSGDGLTIIERTLDSELGAYGLLGARATLSGADSRWQLSAWAKNLNDEKYFVNVTTDDLWSWMELPGQPRSYGVDLSYNW